MLCHAPEDPMNTLPRCRSHNVIVAITLFVFAAPLMARESLYVGNSGENSVAVISIPQHEIERTLRIEAEPDDVVGSSDGATLYISASTQQGDADYPESGMVLAVAADTGRTLWKLPTPGWPNHISLSRDGRRLYVPLFDRQQVLVVDTVSHLIVARLSGSFGMHATRLSSDDRTLYVGSMLTNLLLAFDTDSGALLNSIPFPEAVRPFAITQNQRLAYVQLSKLHGFEVVDLRAGKTLRTVHLPPLPATLQLPDRWPYNVNHGLELSPDEKTLLAAGSIVGTVEAYSLPQLLHLKSIPVGIDPNWIVFSSDGRYAYVSCRKSGEISVIDMQMLKEIKRIGPVGRGPARMRIVAENP
jgi:YVTN family beta-propeller protein